MIVTYPSASAAVMASPPNRMERFIATHAHCDVIIFDPLWSSGAEFIFFEKIFLIRRSFEKVDAIDGSRNRQRDIRFANDFRFGRSPLDSSKRIFLLNLIGNGFVNGSNPVVTFVYRSVTGKTVTVTIKLFEDDNYLLYSSSKTFKRSL